MSGLSLHAIASALGGVVQEGYVQAPGPGHSHHDRSMKVWIDGGGRIACCSFSSDDWRACMDHIRARLGMPVFERGNREAIVKDDRTSEERLAAALERWEKTATDHRADASFASRLWSRAVDPGGTGSATYLAHRSLDLDEGMAGRLVRHLEDCPRRPGNKHPALVVRFAPIIHPAGTVPWGDDPPVECVQRIFLDPSKPKGHDGKWLMGHPFSLPKPFLRDGIVVTDPSEPLLAMKLSSDEEVTTGLHLAEGFETGLASMMAGFRPLWTTYSAEAMARFAVLPGIETLTLMADKDDSGKGEWAALTCCEQWRQAGREARIIIGDEIGDDWADVWEKRK